MANRARTWRRRLLDNPEVNVALFAFLLNLPWEFWQVPFYRGMVEKRHWDGILTCTQASVGDAAIALGAFWLVALGSGSRRWILRPTARRVAGFVAAGIAITVVVEWASTQLLHRWAYSEMMPTLPFLGTGLVPLLQWTVLPPLIVWFVRRQLS